MPSESYYDERVLHKISRGLWRSFPSIDTTASEREWLTVNSVTIVARSEDTKRDTRDILSFLFLAIIVARRRGLEGLPQIY